MRKRLSLCNQRLGPRTNCEKVRKNSRTDAKKWLINESSFEEKSSEKDKNTHPRVGVQANPEGVAPK